VTRDLQRCGRSLAIWLVLLSPGASAFAQGFGGTVSDHLVRGDSLLAQGKTAEAIVQFQEARTLCPTPAEIVASLQGEAKGRLMQNETLPAVGLLEEAATRFPDDPRASNLLYEAGFAAQRSGEIDKAVGLYRRALERNPTKDIVPGLKFQIAQSLRLRGRQGEVLDILKDFEKDYPDHAMLPTVLYTIAIANHDLFTSSGERARLEEAAAIYKRLIEKFPGSPSAIEAHFELGLVQLELGRRSEAAESFNRFVTLNPGSPVAAAALEDAGDMMLFRSPKESAQLYALARVKGKANPKPSDPTLGLGRWLTLKETVAGALSRPWVLGILGVIALGAVVLAGRLIVRRFRKTPAPASA